MTDSTGSTDSDHTHSGAPADPAPTDWFPAHYVQGLRKENAALRVKNKGAGDSDALATANATVKELRLNAAVTDAAIKLGANVRLVRAVLKDAGTLQTIDLDKADAVTAIESLVQVALEEMPELLVRAPSTTPSSSGSIDFQRHEAQPIRELPNRDDIAALKNTNPQAVVDLLHSGQLAHLLNPTGGQ